MSGWFYARQGKTVGPFSWDQLRELARQGELRPDDHVYEDGLGRWLPAESVHGLHGVPAAGRPAPAEPRPQPMPRPRPEPAPQPRPAPQPAPQPRPYAVPPAPQRRSILQRTLTLPKPILFGLCGAVGGLVAALLLGELLWTALRPTSVRSGPSLDIAVPEAMRIYAGGKNRLMVKVARQGISDPVRLELEGAPRGVAAAPVTLGPRDTEAELVVHAGPEVPSGTHRFKARVSVPESSTVPTAAGDVELRIEVPPPSLRLAVSPQVTVHQGSSARFGVKLARANFAGPVPLRLVDAPADIAFNPQLIPAGRAGADIELHVPRSVAAGSQVVTVEAAPGTPLATTATFNLEVLAAPVPAVDVVFVLDLTGSMQFAIDGVKDGIQRFVGELANQRIDGRFGLVAFRDIDDDRERPAVLHIAGAPFTTDVAAFRQSVQALRADGGGDTPESSLQALDLAAQQPFRPGASRVLVLITDAPPKFHPNLPPVTPRDAVAFLRKRGINQVHLVVRRDDADRSYAPFKTQFQGKFFDIEKVQDGVSFASLLPRLGEEISRISVAEAPAAPGSAAPPPLPAGGAPDLPPAAPTLQAVQSTQAFAVEDRGQLIAAIAAWTAAIAAGISMLISAGQHYYLRQTWLRPAAALQSAGGGLLAGLVGGAAGQAFFLASAGGTAWEVVSRIVGWALLGAVLGGGLALFIPNLKPSRALLGGLAGGVLGACTFLVLTRAVGELPGRLLGAAVLGFCIGLMVALAELAFRRWWLEIAYSPREVRTVTLGAASVSIGGDDRLASVFVYGAAPIALRYRVDNDRVLVEDVVAGKSDSAEAGVRRRLGSVTITVCSPASAQQSGYRLQLPGRQPLLLGEGMPLTGDDLPGIEAQAADGVVALVSRRPSDQRVLILRNRSRRPWTVRTPDGKQQTITPGLGVELGPELSIDFGPIQGRVTRH